MARSSRTGGGDLARLRLESGYIHRGEAPPIDVTIRVVRGAVFLAVGVLECNPAHCRSVAVLGMLFKIKSNPMHPLSDALPLPYAPVRVTRGALVVHSHSFTHPRCRTSQYRRTFVLF